MILKDKSLPIDEVVPDMNKIKKAVDMLLESKNPVIIMGGALFYLEQISNVSSLLNTYQYLSSDKEIEKYARDAANTIFKKQAREIESPIESEYQIVNVNSLEIETL